MIKIGTPRVKDKKEWDDQYKSALLGFFISYSDSVINSVQFFYEWDDRVHYSDSTTSAQQFTATNFRKVKLQFPSEYLTRLNGYYDIDNGSTSITSITFWTNKSRYGPYGRTSMGGAPKSTSSCDSDERTGMGGAPKSTHSFDWDLGPNNDFGGFYGQFEDQTLNAIGVYIKPPKTPHQEEEEYMDNLLENSYRGF